MDRLTTILSVLLATLAQQAFGAESCTNRGRNATLELQALEEHGKCIPYDTSTFSLPTPCDPIYEQQKTYVYLSKRRADGEFLAYVDLFDETQLFFSSRVPSRCLEEARKILCHYYLPTCGNETVFEPPTSVCEETCEYLRYLCPMEFEGLAEYFRIRDADLRPLGVTMINCSNTGDYLDPLDHCCSTLDIEPRCTIRNDAGDFVLDPNCNTSDSNPTFPGESGISIGLTVGIATATITTFVTIAIAVVIIILLVRKYTMVQETNKEINGGLHEKYEAFHYQINGEPFLGLPSTSVATRPMARVTSVYIREMAEKDLLIPASHLTFMDTIGQGEFGVVYRGNLTGWGVHKEQNLVAVKTLKGVFGATELSNIMEESIKMAKFNHPNVMRLIGVCIDKGPSPYIVMPYMSYGSLLSYLKKQRADLTLTNDEDQALVTITQTKLLSVCLQVAKGMSYLASQQFVHRDLAARNCMIDENFVLKVADFGLSEDIYARNYFRQTGLQDSEGETSVKLPVRWMALESLHDGIFTKKTDVWSFGITMWEVFSLGRIPYPGVDPVSLLQFLDDGGRLGKPANAACSNDVYSLMCDCWEDYPEERPSFSELVTTISTSLEAIGGYLHLSDWTTPLNLPT